MVELDNFYFLFTPELRIFLRMFRNIFTQAGFWRVSPLKIHIISFVPDVKDNLLCEKIHVITLEGTWDVPGSGPGCLRGLWWFILPRGFVSSAEHTPGLHHLFLIKAEEWIRARFRGHSGRCEADIDIKKRKKKKKKTQENSVCCTTLVSMLTMGLKKKGDALLGKHRTSRTLLTRLAPKFVLGSWA